MVVGEVADAERVAAWLGVDGPLEVSQLSGGRSNLTFRLGDGWVLRRPPGPMLLETAHDVLREHRVQSALWGSGVPVPRMVAACDDPSVIGAPFYVMEYLEGVVHTDPTGLSDPRARFVSDELVDVLARLHAIDPDAVGLGDLGRPDGFLDRQVRRWRRQWDAAKGRDLEAIDETHARLQRSTPRSGPPAIVHGDYNLHNVMFDPDGGMLAVLDWEMATLGDPLTDVALLAVYRGEVGRLLRQPAHPAFPGPDDVAERYASVSGRDLSGIGFYRALATFKLAVICEGVIARGAAGPEAEGLVEALAEAALDACP